MSPKSRWVIICELHDDSDFGSFSGSFFVNLSTYLSIYFVLNVFKIQLGFVHLHITGNRIFYCIEHKTIRLVCC